MRKIVFASDTLPAGFDDRARFEAWREFMIGVYGAVELSRATDRPFSQAMEASQLDGVGMVHMRGTTDRFTRTSRTVAAQTSQGFFLCINRSRNPMSLSQVDREAVFDSSGMALGNGEEAGDLLGKSNNAFSMLVIPHKRLQELVARAEDLVALPVKADTAAMRHLLRYVDLLADDNDIAGDPTLAGHVGRTLTDLIALALGTGRDAAEIASRRGLRAARLQEILATIRTRFADPGFSAQSVAMTLGVSPRYVQNLLWETGFSLGERVLELRLQTAREVLADPVNNRDKVSDIAYRCGFNEASYFNRRFRARFGYSPTQCRADAKR